MKLRVAKKSEAAPKKPDLRFMRRSTAPKSERLGRAPRAARTADATETHPERALKEASQQKIAAQLRLRGVSREQIAEHLGVDVLTVSRLIWRALDDYKIERDQVVQELIAVNCARYDQAMRTWWPDACGVRGDDGDWKVKPNLEAANLALKAMRDLNRLLGQCRPIRVEHTGASGGPIRVFDCSKLTDEELELVIAAEKPEDVAGILQGQGGGGDGSPQEGGGPVH